MIKLRSFVGYDKLSIVDKNRICNGAGAAGDWRSKFIPNTLWGLDCIEAFNIHDHCYHIGITEQDKEAADFIMLTNLFRIIKTGSRFLSPLRHRRAVVYFEAVEMAGSDAFWVNKKHNGINQRTYRTIEIDYDN